MKFCMFCDSDEGLDNDVLLCPNCGMGLVEFDETTGKELEK